MIMARKKRAVGYARVSTKMQGRDGISLDAQHSKLEAMASVKDLEMTEILTETGSGKELGKRPELQKILRMVDRREIDAVIVYSLDRLTRNIEHLCELIRRMNKAKVSLISVTESLDTKTATGRLMVRLIGELSQWQREYISERTSETMRAAQAAGLRMGNPNKVPYGWTVDPKDPKRIIPDQDERDILEIMIARHKEGASYGEIAEELNADDLLNRAGGEWSRATIYKILKRELGHKN